MEQPADAARRRFNLTDTIMIVSGSMIGSGIFIVTADMTRVLGSPAWVIGCWIISGIITLFAALSYGELAGMMPEAGGQFIYLKRAFGRFVSFLYGWSVFMVIQTGVIAAVAVAFARYLLVLVPGLAGPPELFSIAGHAITSSQLIAVACVIFLTWINSMGIQNGKTIQRVFTAAKIIALIAVIVTGFVAASPDTWQLNMNIPFAGSPVNADPENTSAFALIGAVGVALIGSLFSSDAWNNVTFIAGEVKNPRKNIFLGLLIGVTLVSMLYVLANIAYFMLLPATGSPDATTVIGRGIAHAEHDRVGTAALFPVFGETSVIIMALLIVVSTFGCNNGLILAGARLFQSMSANGLFFKGAGKLNKHQVPGKALWFQCYWTCVLCLSGSYGSLLDYCTFASLLFYIVTIAGLFVLRKKEPLTPRPYKAFGYPVIPALYIILASAICIDLLIFKTRNTALGLAIISIGIPVYFLFKEKNAPVPE
jgi:basic amino acid/polyamine antiporter, APA family